MYEIRFGDRLPSLDVEALRGIEGSRVRASYKILAQRYGLSWQWRDYDRQHPENTDTVNMAVNHAAVAMYAAAEIAVAATSTVPQLGFIHERSAIAFALDIADMLRSEITVPIAFEGVKQFQQDPQNGLERCVRKLAGEVFAKKKVISRMIDLIKDLLSHPEPETPPCP